MANPGIPLDLARVRDLDVDPAAVRKRVASIRRSRPSGRERAARLLEAVACLDLTALSGDDTPARVRRLCETARRPLPEDLLERSRELLGPGSPEVGPRGPSAGPPRGPAFPGTPAERIRVAAVCVYPALVETALRALEGSGIPVASVAGGFPHGLTLLPVRVAEVRAVREVGADEIDVVIARRHALAGDWERLHEEVRAFREAAGEARLKVILATGELIDDEGDGLETAARAGLVGLMAGADFLKTSTGMERVNATLPAGLALARAIRRYRELTGRSAGLKPAGGISRASRALEWSALARGELGPEWSTPSLFRIGASSLLGDLEAELRSTCRRWGPSG